MAERPAEVPKNAYRHRVRVVAADIDDQGHTSNVRVLAWMNEAAIEHSNALGFDVPRYREIGGIFVVRRHEIDYHAPSYEGEEISAYTWPIAPVRRSLARRRHVIVRDSDQIVIARGVNQWVFIDLERGRPMTMPPEVLERFDPQRWEPE